MAALFSFCRQPWEASYDQKCRKWEWPKGYKGGPVIGLPALAGTPSPPPSPRSRSFYRQGDVAGASKTVQAILAYDGLHPHWAYSGSARRWWGESSVNSDP